MKEKFSKKSLDYAKQMVKIMQELKEEVVFVEGKRDKAALSALGITKTFAISGTLRAVCEKLASANVAKVVVLTDLDRRGNELAELAQQELERYSIFANTDYRRILGKVLRIKHFEELDKKYNEYLEELTWQRHTLIQ